MNQKKLTVKNSEDYVMLGLSEREAKALFGVLEKMSNKINSHKLDRSFIISRVAKVVSDFFDVPMAELINGGMKKERIYCVRLISSILKNEYDIHPAEIGEFLKLDRTSIIHHIKYYSSMTKSHEHQDVYKAIMQIIINEDGR